MQIKKKPTAWWLFASYAAWTLLVQPIWNLNVERVAEENQFDGALAGAGPLTLLREIAAYLPSSFAAGFVGGALIFAYWENIRAKWVEWRGKAPGPDLRVWVGRMSPEFDPTHRRLRLWIYIINLGDREFSSVAVAGSVLLKTAGGVFNLASPRVHLGLEAGALDNGAYGPIVVELDCPLKFWRHYPEQFMWTNPRTYLKFGDLELSLITSDGLTKRVPLWESMRLTAGEDQVCAVETFPVFESEGEKARFDAALTAFSGHHT